MNKLNFLWTFPALFIVSVFVGLVGSHTTHYQCKYVKDVEIKVPDHEKYASAVYAIHYSDGTVGVDDMFGYNGPQGVDRGTLCRTVLQWGWPYSGTNRDIKDESTVKAQ